MYHYVRPFDSELPYLNHLHIEDFKKQLDFFEDHYGFITQKEFINSLKTGNTIKGVILTFDDGLSCHYNHVFKELQDRGLWGIFYIPTSPYKNNKLLDVHRIHLLLAKYNSMDIFSFLENILDDSFFDSNKLNEFKDFTYKRQKNDNYTLLVKRMLNYYISYNHRTNILDQLMNNYFPNENEIAKKFYLNKDQILKMHKNRMIIGSHSVNHYVMSRLDNNDQETEIIESFSYLENIVGNFNHKTFCYPYGGFHSFENHTERILERNNCLYSFNVEQRDIELNDLCFRKQALPRYDCNQFNYGEVRNNLKKNT